MKRKERESKDKIISRKSRSLFFLRRYGLYVPAYAAVGIAVGALGTVLAFRLESGLKTAMTLIFFCILSAAAAADQKTQEVPGICILLLAIIGIISFFFFSELSWPERLAGFLIISVPMYLLALVVPGGFGGGDLSLIHIFFHPPGNRRQGLYTSILRHFWCGVRQALCPY